MVRKSDQPKPIKRKKVYVNFDENARKDYLTGFRKRREERKVKAQQMLDKKLKDKIKQERNKRKKTTQEKVDKILEGINLPGETEESNQINEANDKVDFGTHEVLIKSCIDYGESGLIVAPSQEDELNEEVVEDNEKDGNEEGKPKHSQPDKRYKKKMTNFKHSRNKQSNNKKKYTKNKKEGKPMKQKGKHKK